MRAATPPTAPPTRQHAPRVGVAAVEYADVANDTNTANNNTTSKQEMELRGVEFEEWRLRRMSRTDEDEMSKIVGKKVQEVGRRDRRDEFFILC